MFKYFLNINKKMLVYKGLNKIYRHDEVEKIKRMIENDYDTASSSNTHFSYRLEKYLCQVAMK